MIHQFRACMPPDWMWHNHKTTGLFTLQGVVNGNGRQKGADGRALGKEAVRQHRPWTQPLSLLLSGSVSSSSCFSHASLNSFGRWISLWTCPLNHVSHYFHILSFSKSQMSFIGWQPAEGEQGCLLHSAFIRNPYLCSASELSKAESGSFFSGKSQRVACSPQQPAASMF